ncbi:SDR family oxidoreductase [Variovorax sp. LjRoot178]|uniref:SDR family oxidoreductase n=1 Tax=Variovorax sp. LjRoot178 TaxID=3342277 RepID=UPI003ECECFD8
MHLLGRQRWDHTPLARRSATAFDLVTRFTPRQRAARPDEIAGLVLFLTSSDSTLIRGEDIAIDGGLFGYIGKQAGAIGQGSGVGPQSQSRTMALRMRELDPLGAGALRGGRGRLARPRSRRGVIHHPEALRAYESEGLTAYRQPKMVAIQAQSDPLRCRCSRHRVFSSGSAPTSSSD